MMIAIFTDLLTDKPIDPNKYLSGPGKKLAEALGVEPKELMKEE
jgi:hypothetical protein